ncbi:MAG: TolC family protein [Bacteroidales bacterium]|nr:TolC family protein [Candidatus Colimorpha pelethequi]
MKNIIPIILLLCLSFGSHAQNRYQWVLDLAKDQGIQLQQLQQEREAAMYTIQSTPILDQPEIEFGHFWGAPTEIGNRWDLSVSQTFPFPTTWVHEAKARKLEAESSQLHYDVETQQLLGEIQQLCCNLVYCNAAVKIYSRCATTSQEIAETYAKRMEAGDCNILEFNRAQMDFATQQSKLNKALAEQASLLQQLQLVAPNESVSFTQDQYEPIVLPDFETLLSDIKQYDSRYAYFAGQEALAQEEVKVAQSQWLPDLSLGYASETVTGEAFRGVTIGARLNLWNNRNKTRTAKASLSAIQSSTTTNEQQLHNYYASLYQKALSLQENLQKLQQTYQSNNSLALLKKALDAGEISLEQYLLSVDCYNDAELSILETQHDLEETYLRLMVIK